MITVIPMADLLLSALSTNSFNLDENILLSTQTEGHFENWKVKHYQPKKEIHSFFIPKKNASNNFGGATGP